jgi:hypothetical protein
VAVDLHGDVRAFQVLVEGEGEPHLHLQRMVVEALADRAAGGGRFRRLSGCSLELVDDPADVGHGHGHRLGPRAQLLAVHPPLQGHHPVLGADVDGVGPQAAGEAEGRLDGSRDLEVLELLAYRPHLVLGFGAEVTGVAADLPRRRVQSGGASAEPPEIDGRTHHGQEHDEREKSP